MLTLQLIGLIAFVIGIVIATIVGLFVHNAHLIPWIAGFLLIGGALFFLTVPWELGVVALAGIVLGVGCLAGDGGWPLVGEALLFVGGASAAGWAFLMNYI